MALIAFGALLQGSYSRFGLWRQIAVAVVLMVIVQGLSTASVKFGLRVENGWILAYLAPALAVVTGVRPAMGVATPEPGSAPVSQSAGSGMILDLYIARRFLWLFIRVFAGFFTVMAAIGVIEELRRFSGKGIAMTEALGLSMLNVPTSIYQILPLIMILSAIGLFSGAGQIVGTGGGAGFGAVGSAVSGGSGCDGLGDRLSGRCGLESGHGGYGAAL